MTIKEFDKFICPLNNITVLSRNRHLRLKKPL